MVGAQTRRDPQLGKTRNSRGVGCAGKAVGLGGSSCAGICNQVGVLRMPKRALRFAHVGEAGFVNKAIADSPGMAQVVLLEALLNRVAESRQIGACRLKIVKGIEISFV